MRADLRVLRFDAVATTPVLASARVTESARLLAARAVGFASGAVRRSSRPTLSTALVERAPKDTEDARPARFAQGAGLALAVAGEAGHLAGITPPALLAAILIAAFGSCLGCETYLLIRRLLPAAKLEVSQ